MSFYKQGRYFRPKAKEIKGTKYDSLTEKKLHEGIFKGLSFHCDKVDYTISHKYEPDFSFTNKGGKKVLIEVKGFFQDASELQKYKSIIKCLDTNTELVLVFEKPNNAIHFQKKRKDGSKMSHKEWAEKSGIRWFDLVTAKELLEEI